MFSLFNIIFGGIAMALDYILGISFGEFGIYGPLYLIYGLAMFLPGLAVGVRRLHDVGKSGWMYLIALIPFIGAIWLLVLMVTDGESSENNYGINPKSVTTD